MNYMPEQNNRVIGKKYEEIAKDFLISLGYNIYELNFRNKYGEIDIIAQDDKFLVFVEVKYRANIRHGHPREAVNYLKQANIIKVANCYIMQNNLIDNYCRFDVIEIYHNNINHVINAFWEG